MSKPRKPKGHLLYKVMADLAAFVRRAKKYDVQCPKCKAALKLLIFRGKK